MMFWVSSFNSVFPRDFIAWEGFAHPERFGGATGGNFNYLLRLLSLDQNNMHVGAYLNLKWKLSSDHFSEWPWKLGFWNLLFTHQSACPGGTPGKRALLGRLWEAGPPRNRPDGKGKAALVLAESRDSGLGRRRGRRGRPWRRSHRPRLAQVQPTGLRNWPSFFSPCRAASAGSSAIRAPARTPSPRAPRRAQPPPAAGNVPADVGRAAAPLRWCLAPGRPRPGRNASFDLRLPELSCGDRLGSASVAPLAGPRTELPTPGPKFSRDLRPPSGCLGKRPSLRRGLD